ncbi:MAG TPA: chorismate mutase, partial [Rhodospirillaceae bacterium]|nr:chorismate mutase [Rhodospirillaceae bacterium]
RQRYDVIEEVGALKAARGIAATLPDRVEEVRENAAKMAAESGLDA